MAHGWKESDWLDERLAVVQVLVGLGSTKRRVQTGSTSAALCVGIWEKEQGRMGHYPLTYVSIAWRHQLYDKTR